MSLHLQRFEASLANHRTTPNGARHHQHQIRPYLFKQMQSTSQTGSSSSGRLISDLKAPFVQLVYTKADLHGTRRRLSAPTRHFSLSAAAESRTSGGAAHYALTFEQRYVKSLFARPTSTKKQQPQQQRPGWLPRLTCWCLRGLRRSRDSSSSSMAPPPTPSPTPPLFRFSTHVVCTYTVCFTVLYYLTCFLIFYGCAFVDMLALPAAYKRAVVASALLTAIVCAVQLVLSLRELKRHLRALYSGDSNGAPQWARKRYILKITDLKKKEKLRSKLFFKLKTYE